MADLQSSLVNYVCKAENINEKKQQVTGYKVNEDTFVWRNR